MKAILLKSKRPSKMRNAGVQTHLPDGGSFNASNFEVMICVVACCH